MSINNPSTIKEDPYAKFLVKSYRYWSIYVHEHQQYLGRCVIWCHRDDATDLTNATSEEFAELQQALIGVKDASAEIFQPDWFNYSFLGNETPHLHGHFIPRYRQSKEFEGVLFTDELYGANYKTNHSYVTPSGIVEKVIQRYRDYFKEKQ